MEEKILELEKKHAELKSNLESCWLYHLNDGSIVTLKEEIMHKLSGSVVKLLVASFVIMSGAAYFLIEHAVSEAFDKKNDSLIAEFKLKYERNFEWKRFHDYGKSYTYLAEMYAESPIDTDLKVEKIRKNYSYAEDYFKTALTFGSMPGTTYWELGELYYTYPKRDGIHSLIDKKKALGYYTQAIGRYTDNEVAQGWEAEAQLFIAKVYLDMSKTNSQDKDDYIGKARTYLKSAENGYKSLGELTSIDSVNNSEEISSLLIKTEQLSK